MVPCTWHVNGLERKADEMSLTKRKEIKFELAKMVCTFIDL